MRLFKGFIIVLTGLFIFSTLLSLLIPSKVVITKSVLIHAGAEKVFAEISNLLNKNDFFECGRIRHGFGDFDEVVFERKG